jgi:hypothetical protein
LLNARSNAGRFSFDARDRVYRALVTKEPAAEPLALVDLDRRELIGRARHAASEKFFPHLAELKSSLTQPIQPA